ncbi:MAG: hypothetical protein JSV82_02405, partial [Planctomycetota bacterium]
MLLKEKVHDYDVYFDCKEAVEAVAEYYIDQFIAENPDKPEPELKVEDDRVKIYIKSAGVVDAADSERDVEDEELDNDLADEEVPEGKKKYRPIYLSSNAITLANGIQIVIRFYGSPDEIHENYDFTHCTNWWTSKDNHIELRKEALECLLTRELRYQGSKYPLCSIIRTRKFIKRGFTINAGQYVKMAMQLNELELTDIDILEDQLTGVDTAYFYQMIESIRTYNSPITPDYLSTIIDRIF